MPTRHLCVISTPARFKHTDFAQNYVSAMSDPALSDQSPSVQLKQFAAKSPNPAYVVDLGAPDSAHVSDSHVWWKMDLYILPVATLIFFLSFLVSPSFIAVLRHAL